MKYTPDECPKCASPLARNPTGGRPTRWCCEGCKRSGEAEMSRVLSLLSKLEEGRAVDQLNGHGVERRDQIIAELHARYDHLAGVPKPFLTIANH